jgi:hypothetical protein
MKKLFAIALVSAVTAAIGLSAVAEAKSSRPNFSKNLTIKSKSTVPAASSFIGYDLNVSDG